MPDEQLREFTLAECSEQLLAENAKLKAEVERLREEISKLRGQQVWIEADKGNLRDEVERLRGLVRDAFDEGWAAGVDDLGGNYGFSVLRTAEEDWKYSNIKQELEGET